jgi:dihydroorotase
MDAWIANGMLFDTESQSFSRKCLHFKADLITEISDSLPADAEGIIDAENSYILPGFIDIHTHLRQPGQEAKETIESGTKAAAKGGYTTLTAMANTSPPIDDESKWMHVNQIIEKDALIKVIQAGTISKNLQGMELSELLQKGRCSVYSDDGKGLANSKLLAEAIKLAQKYGSLLIMHEEDSLLSEHGVVAKGILTERYELPGIPASSESSIIARDLLIAHELDYPLHFTHLSSAQSIRFLACTKELSYDFTCDTTPHHLFFSDADIDPQNTDFKVNPPLRSEYDRQSLIKALKTGVISCIGSDHAPHTPSEKAQDFLHAPFGISGIETAFPALFTSLVLPGYLSLEELVSFLTNKPASLLKLSNTGALKPSYKADITIVKLHSKTLSKCDLISKGKNNPFVGQKLTAWPVMTIYGGNIVYQSDA